MNLPILSSFSESIGFFIRIKTSHIINQGIIFCKIHCISGSVGVYILKRIIR